MASSTPRSSFRRRTQLQSLMRLRINGSTGSWGTINTTSPGWMRASPLGTRISLSGTILAIPGIYLGGIGASLAWGLEFRESPECVRERHLPWRLVRADRSEEHVGTRQIPTHAESGGCRYRYGVDPDPSFPPPSSKHEPNHGPSLGESRRPLISIRLQLIAEYPPSHNVISVNLSVSVFRRDLTAGER